MKKRIAISMALIMAFSVVSCGKAGMETEDIVDQYPGDAHYWSIIMPKIWCAGQGNELQTPSQCHLDKKMQ